MWWKLREAIKTSLALQNDSELEQELTSIEYFHDSKDRLLLEKKEEIKKRGLSSPDHADALALTYAMPVTRRVSANVNNSYIKNHNPLSDLYQ